MKIGYFPIVNFSNNILGVILLRLKQGIIVRIEEWFHVITLK